MKRKEVPPIEPCGSGSRTLVLQKGAILTHGALVRIHHAAWLGSAVILAAAIGVGGSAHGARLTPAVVRSVTQTVLRLPTAPVALAADARTGRVFVVTGETSAPYLSGLAIIDARTNKLLAPVRAALDHAGDGLSLGSGSPFGAALLGNVAVDEASGRAFVISPGNTDRRTAALFGSAHVFTLDAITGRVLASATLSFQYPGPGTIVPASIVVDSRSNRVFTDNGATDRLNVLDATTGKLLSTVVFPSLLSPNSPSTVRPLGVDRHDGGVLVEAPDGLVLVDERTGKPLRAIHLPDNQGFEDGLVDGQHGQAVLAVNVDQNDNFVNTVETVNLATGKLLTGLGGPKTVLLLALDERSGRALVLEQSSEPPMLTVLNDRTREETHGIPLYTQGVTGTVNPTTGHGLVLSSSGVLVVDLRTGALLANHNLALGVLPANVTRALVVDAATKHVFVSNPTNNTVIMLDASKL